MRRVQSVLLIPDADLDVPSWSWIGTVATSIPDHERAWGQALLDPAKPLAVFLSLPSTVWTSYGEQLRTPWEHEKEQIGLLMGYLRVAAGLAVRGPLDLTGVPGQEAVARAQELIREHEQVLGITHVGVEEECAECHSKARTGGRETVCGGCGASLPRYFEVGHEGRLNGDALGQIARMQVGSSGERRLLVLGCETVRGNLCLPRAIIREGLSALFLATADVRHFDELLCLLTALLACGWAGTSREVLNRAYGTYLKLRSIQLQITGTRSQGIASGVVLEGPPSPGRPQPSYYVAEPCADIPDGSGVPHLRPVSVGELPEVVSRLAREATDDGLVVLDVPPRLRTFLAPFLHGAPGVWVARGSALGSVRRAVLDHSQEYHVATVGARSEYMTYRFLSDFYACVAVRGLSIGELERLLGLGSGAILTGMEMQQLLRSLAGLVGDHPVVIGMKPAVERGPAMEGR